MTKTMTVGRKENDRRDGIISIITLIILIILVAAIAFIVGKCSNDDKASTQKPSLTTQNEPLKARSDTTGTAQSTASTSTAPYNLPPQPQIGHPSLYLETGVPCISVGGNFVCKDVDAHTKTYKIEILPDAVAIVGGFKVDGVDGGVYKAVAGPGMLETTVTDGFVAITKKEWGQSEWCFRIGQAIQYNWAHKHETPLPGWTCGTTQTQGATYNIRQETGIGKTLPFSAGADVIGVDIVLDNGMTYHSCRIASAPTGGKVTTGVIGPNTDEIAKAQACK